MGMFEEWYKKEVNPEETFDIATFPWSHFSAWNAGHKAGTDGLEHMIARIKELEKQVYGGTTL